MKEKGRNERNQIQLMNRVQRMKERMEKIREE